jgi:hypothetical protein
MRSAARPSAAQCAGACVRACACACALRLPGWFLRCVRVCAFHPPAHCERARLGAAIAGVTAQTLTPTHTHTHPHTHTHTHTCTHTYTHTRTRTHARTHKHTTLSRQCPPTQAGIASLAPGHARISTPRPFCGGRCLWLSRRAAFLAARARPAAARPAARPRPVAPPLQRGAARTAPRRTAQRGAAAGVRTRAGGCAPTIEGACRGPPRPCMAAQAAAREATARPLACVAHVSR